MPNLQDLPLDSINVYGGTQARVATNDDAIASYADEMSQGAVFPPIVVYFDGATHWLADGFHRYLAAKRIERPAISAESMPAAAPTPCATPSAPTPPTASIATTPTNETPSKSPSRNGPTSPIPSSPKSARSPSNSSAAPARK